MVGIGPGRNYGGGGGSTGYGTNTAYGAGVMSEKEENRSELLSTPLDRTISPPPKSPDRLVPGAGGVRSWGSPSISQQGATHSSQSVSDYDENRHEQPSPPLAGAGPGYLPAHQHDLDEHQGRIHELAENQTVPSRPERTVSGPSDGYQLPGMSPDGYWHDTQNAQELQGSDPQRGQRLNSGGSGGYRGVDPEVPLHQRMQNERVPIRPGHLTKERTSEYGPSQNF